MNSNIIGDIKKIKLARTNFIELGKEIINIIDNSEYVDISEEIYNISYYINYISLFITRNNIDYDNNRMKKVLYDFHLFLQSNDYVDIDDGLEKAKIILDNYF